MRSSRAWRRCCADSSTPAFASRAKPSPTSRRFVPIPRRWSRCCSISRSPRATRCVGSAAGRCAGPLGADASLRSAPGQTVLLVEDGEALREVLHRVLLELGYTVHVAKDGEEALEVSTAHHGPIHLLITDVVMP